MMVCPDCEGEGSVETHHPNDPDGGTVRCERCDGVGTVRARKCYLCGGAGENYESTLGRRYTLICGNCDGTGLEAE